ncbi:MAG: hypothetical protein K0Q46_2734 [Rhodococcus erythropolis]|jgi:hypothetical protein|nr:hypothetical protein [Rhodococcus erythropolis]
MTTTPVNHSKNAADIVAHAVTATRAAAPVARLFKIWRPAWSARLMVTIFSHTPHAGHIGRCWNRYRRRPSRWQHMSRAAPRPGDRN